MVNLLYQRFGAIFMSMHRFAKLFCLSNQAFLPILLMGKLSNLFNFDSKRGVYSVKQLARYLNMYRTKKNILDIVNDIYNSKIETVKTLTDERKARYYDEAVETAFHIYRH